MDGPHGGTQLPSSAVPGWAPEGLAQRAHICPRLRHTGGSARAEPLAQGRASRQAGAPRHPAVSPRELSPLTRSASPAKAKGDCTPVPGRHARMGTLDTKTHRRPKLAASRPRPHSPGAHGDRQQPAPGVLPPVGPAPRLFVSPAMGHSGNLPRNQPGTSQPRHDFPRTWQPRATTAGHGKRKASSGQDRPGGESAAYGLPVQRPHQREPLGPYVQDQSSPEQASLENPGLPPESRRPEAA